MIVANPPRIEAPFTIPPDLEVPAHFQRIYHQAHDLLEQEGWCQRLFANRRGNHCLVGAIAKASGSYAPVAFIEREVLGSAAVEWNDAQGRTQDHVLSLLEELYDEPV